MTLRGKLSILACVLVFAGCTKAQRADSPEAALTNYVNAAFSAKSVTDKKKLMEMSTGDALTHLESMKDEEFKAQFLESSLRLVSLKAKDLRQENDGDVSLVYELSFQDGKVGNSAVHTNKKVAYLTKLEGGWKIKATKNVKTFLEKKEDLVITPETTHKENAPTKK